MSEIIVERSAALDNLFYQYTHLPIGGKYVRCPYWMNDLKRGIFGPFGGKGNPEQIVQATLEEAARKKVFLESLTENEIYLFMKENRIGVDCSGFVFWMLNALDIEKGGDGIANDIICSEQILRPSRANVATLTDLKNVEMVNLQNVKVGDLIRLNKGKHVAIVIGISRDSATEKIVKIEYAHSSSKTLQEGVHQNFIKIINDSLPLGQQEWLERDKNYLKYSLNNFFPLQRDGLYRLKCFV